MKFGTIAAMSPAWRTPERSRSAEVNAEIATGTSCRFSARRCAVTMISSNTGSAQLAGAAADSSAPAIAAARMDVRAANTGRGLVAEYAGQVSRPFIGRSPGWQ